MSAYGGWSVAGDEVVAELGAGSSGRIRVVRGPGTMGVRPLLAARDVAPEVHEDPELREQVAQYILHATDITHPGWTRVLGAMEIGDEVCLATELVAGCAIDDLAGGALSVGTVEHVVAKTAAVLESLHRGRDALGRPRRMVHGSVTPDKVMLSFAGDVKLLDFGVTHTCARSWLPPAQWPDALRPWVPPELLDHADPSPATDLYMLGVTMYFLLTGQPPYPPGTLFEPEAWASLPPPSSLRDEVRPSLDELVLSMLEPTPDQRPVSAQQIQDVLNARPSRMALSSVVKDAAPDRLRWIESLTEQEEAAPPLVQAEPIEAIPPTVPRGAPAFTDQQASEAAVSPQALRSAEIYALPSRPDAPAPEHIGRDSVEILRASVRQIFAEPNAPAEALRALPASTAPPPAPLPAGPPGILELPSLTPPPASWRRPLGALMLVCAALVLTALVNIEPEPSLLEVRVKQREASVQVLERPSAGPRTPLPPGRYRVRAFAEGYEAVEIGVQLDPAEHRILLVDLAGL